MTYYKLKPLTDYEREKLENPSYITYNRDAGLLEVSNLLKNPDRDKDDQKTIDNFILKNPMMSNQDADTMITSILMSEPESRTHI